MKLITLPFPKLKINKKIIIGALVVILFLAAITGYIWLQKTGKISQFNVGLFLGKLTGGFSKKETPAEPKAAATEAEGEEIVSTGKNYEEAAQAGEGITHLARRALKEYLEDKGEGLNLIPEHKIYIEDYIQNKTGDRLLMLGEKITISEDLIVEAIKSSQQLTSQQLENLEQYSALVPSL